MAEWRIYGVRGICKAWGMQIIIHWETGVAEYAAQELHRTVCAPESCPGCGKAGCLEALGYYQRWVSEEDTGKAVRISVRRFFAWSAESR